MIDYRSVQIQHQGRTYSARYCVTDGLLQVDSAYGSRHVPAPKRGDPKGRAEKLLQEIVKAR